TPRSLIGIRQPTSAGSMTRTLVGSIKTPGSLSNASISSSAGTLTPSYARPPAGHSSLVSSVSKKQAEKITPLSKVPTPGLTATNSFSGLRQPSSLNKLPRNASTSLLRNTTGSSLHSTPTRTSDTDLYTSLPSAFAKRSTGSRRPDVRGIFNQENEFLTLRPVHTPDLIPRRCDPRLVERAMTPMLKTDIVLMYSRLAAQMSRDNINEDDEDDYEYEELPPKT
ncbi:hypothetical protein GGI12_004575, partial [Dipsacomyces acuminosporus]